MQFNKIFCLKHIYHYFTSIYKWYRFITEIVLITIIRKKKTQYKDCLSLKLGMHLNDSMVLKFKITSTWFLVHHHHHWNYSPSILTQQDIIVILKTKMQSMASMHRLVAPVPVRRRDVVLSLGSALQKHLLEKTLPGTWTVEGFPF